jgi:hypothetical protein
VCLPASKTGKLKRTEEFLPIHPQAEYACGD